MVPIVKILIVDDDPALCNNLSEVLSEKGYSVKAATSGENALEHIDREEFDIVLVDLVMPDINGMDLLTEIKREKPNTQVIMITAFATVENAVESMKKGASDYISKPFKINEVEIAVKRALEEAKFKERMLSFEKSVEIEKLISSLTSEIRRGVISFLRNGKYSFTEIMKTVNVDDPTKLNFHLRKLKLYGLVEQDSKRKYFLTQAGKRALEILKQLESGR